MTTVYNPVYIAQQHIGKKWILPILYDMLQGRNRFSQYLHYNSKLTSKVLSDTLQYMEKYQLIQKQVVSITPIKVEYTIKAKGKKLKNVIDALVDYAMIEFPEDLDQSS